MAEIAEVEAVWCSIPVCESDLIVYLKSRHRTCHCKSASALVLILMRLMMAGNGYYVIDLILA